MSPAPKIVIAAGGTAGHVVPALAVADALRAEGAQVTFIGGERAEAELVPASGYPLQSIAVEGLSRTSLRRAARGLALAGRAVLRSYKLLRQLRPDAVMGGGGYVAAPVGLAAIARKVPLVLAEADSHLGLANRALAPFAKRVCLAFPIEGRESRRYRFTGRPIPYASRDRVTARERFGLKTGERCVLVFGGSLGARSINEAAVEAFGSSAAPATGATLGAGAALDSGTAPGSEPAWRPGPFRVLHVCGRRDYPEIADRALPAGYDLREYLDLEQFADALAAADLVVARAGGSVFEIAAAGVPAILVPYPHAAADHQSANARWMANAGAALVIPDEQLSGPRLSEEVARLLSSPSRLQAMAAASRDLARPDAARQIAAELLLAAGRGVGDGSAPERDTGAPASNEAPPEEPPQ